MPALDHDATRRRAGDAAAGRFPGADVVDLRRLPGGLSSLTFAARLVHDAGALDVVLKVAPPGLPPVHNRDVLRQGRILTALARRPGFPVPAVLFTDPGEPPALPPLIGMERVVGQAYEPMLDIADQPPTPDVAAERMRVAAHALAALHGATPAELGLDDEPVVGLDEECLRWTRLLETVEADICPGHEDLARRLRARLPPALPARVHHGDYRVANMLFDGATLGAVIDWEIWSVGDPRWDLAWLVLHTAPAHLFHHERPAADRAAGSRVPAADALVAQYGRDADDLDWFLAASQYKGASTVAALYKRERRRPDPDPTLMTAGAHLGRLLEAGHRALDRWT